MLNVLDKLVNDSLYKYDKSMSNLDDHKIVQNTLSSNMRGDNTQRFQKNPGFERLDANVENVNKKLI